MKQEDQIKQTVQAQFGRNAEKYVKSESHAKGDDLPLLLEWLQPKPDWLALDIATGGGHVAKTLAPHCGHVFATDVTRAMLQAAAGHIRQSGLDNLFFVVADAEALPFLDNSFDAVTCRIAPHHFPHPEKFVAEVSRVLRPGGSFLLIDNVAPEDDELAAFINTVEKLRDESHVRCPSVAEWKTWLQRSSLVELQSRARRKTFQFSSWVERTCSSEQQRKQVEQFILAADERLQEYFAVNIEQGEVKSLETDEWMILCRKQA